ncbi:TetR family transcriptional regulator [Nocardia sp. NPDC051463]|uniref:TetR/AcrR family transcriptional regulator n=1 Tax=Nocardia sp. NPDC051463 TaxID=3154845 RepID=UPI00344C7AA2
MIAPRRTARPAHLTTVGIVRAAVEVADNNGIDGLSMSRLAGELGIATACLYRHPTARRCLLRWPNSCSPKSRHLRHIRRTGEPGSRTRPAKSGGSTAGTPGC